MQGLNYQECSPSRKGEEDAQESEYENAGESGTVDCSPTVKKLFYLPSSAIIYPYDACLVMINFRQES